MGTHKAIDGRAVGIMVLLCMVWGLQQIAIKLAAHDMTPMMQIGIRSGLAAVLVGALMGLRRERLHLAGGLWRPALLVGCLFGLEFVLIGEGLRHTSAGHMAVFLYTAPVFAALGLHFRLASERLHPLQWGGIALAFAGIAVAFFGRTAGASNQASLHGDLLGVLAGAAWGFTTVAVRCSRLSTAPATETLLYQLIGAFVMLMAASAWMGQAEVRLTPIVWQSLVFQTLVVSFASYLVWFWLLRQYIASRLGVFSVMTPLFGVGFGVWLLHEPLEPSFVAGAVLVLAGITVVSGQRWVSQAVGRLRPS